MDSAPPRPHNPPRPMTLARPTAESVQFEKIPAAVFPDAHAGALAAAAEIAALLRARNGAPVVLGLATGSTPVALYRELIRLHREEGLSFRHVTTFNLDEYFGLPPEHPESYHRFMREQLFQHIDIDPARTRIPDGRTPRATVFDACAAYEEAIRAAGGIDLQILGIGRSGHIGFNEPGAGPDTRTRLVTLDRLTRRDAARDFRGEANVPRHAITMGVGTILDARAIRLLAWGEGKAAAVAQAVEGPQTPALPASFLQRHPNARFILDAPAASALTRFRQPWRTGPVEWTPARTRQAVVWLAAERAKPILKLTDEDYSEHGLAELLTERGPAYQLNIAIFNDLQHTITGWPGGKPGADDTHRPVPATPPSKRVLVLSPEPLDAEHGMGGTLHRLAAQGHKVTVACLTSGNLAVPDNEAALAADLVADLASAFHPSPAAPNPAGSGPAGFARAVINQLDAKEPFDADSPDIRRLKGLVRRGETRAACAACGIPADQVRFLDLPFYETGRYRQFQPEPADAARVAELLRALQPDLVFTTGALADPASVAACGFRLVHEALASLDPARRPRQVWLFSSGDRAWEVHDIGMAVPLSPDELARKTNAVSQHRSQRNQSLGADPWQAAAELNRAAARAYDSLGLADYEALETFKRWS